MPGTLSYLRGLAFAKKLAQTFRDKTPVFGSTPRWFQLSAVKQTDDTGDGKGGGDQISVEELLMQFSQKVDESRLSHDELSIHKAHMKAIEEKRPAYNDPVTGFEVFTILSHLERGYCCGNLCRHCAYSYKNCEWKYKVLKKHNSAFYS